MKKKWCAFLVVLLLLFPSSVDVQAFFSIPIPISQSPQHSGRDFSEMTYEHYDGEVFTQKINQVEELCQKSENAEQVISLFYEASEEFEQISRNYTLAALFNCLDYTDSYYVQEMAYLTELAAVSQDLFAQTGKKILDSPCGEAARKNWVEEDILYFEEYQELTEEELALVTREQELLQSYHELAGQEYSTLVKGRERTVSEIIQLYQSDPSFTLQEYEKAIWECSQRQNQALGAIFLELVSIRNQIALSEGYDNYSDYAYAEIFDRLYTPQDLAFFREEVKTHIVPLAQEMGQFRRPDLEAAVNQKSYTPEDCIALLEKYIPEISREMEESLTYMLTHHLYDISPSQTKIEGGLTAYIPGENVPFLFDSPDGSVSDFQTLVHEFGHFHSMMQQSEESLNGLGSSLDLSEIHSQGLEMLFLQFYGQIWGTPGEAEAYRKATDLLDSIISGCMQDEFQIQVYTHPEMTLEEINACYWEIAGEYGIDLSRLLYKAAYDWTNVPHTFIQPLYYISYANSAVPSLEILLTSAENPRKGVNQYLTLVSYGEAGDFTETLQRCKLSNPFHEGSIQQLSQKFREYATRQAAILEGKAPEVKKLDYFQPILISVVTTGGLGILGLSCLLIAFFRKRN